MGSGAVLKATPTVLRPPLLVGRGRGWRGLLLLEAGSRRQGVGTGGWGLGGGNTECVAGAPLKAIPAK
jgi:hypothetical protein